MLATREKWRDVERNREVEEDKEKKGGHNRGKLVTNPFSCIQVQIGIYIPIGVALHNGECSYELQYS